MMAGATEEECKRYDCGKASVTNCINLLRDDNLEPRLFLSLVNELRKLLIEYEGYQKQYGLKDPWYDKLCDNTILAEVHQKVSEMKMLKETTKA